jgi:hypothetical protein
MENLQTEVLELEFHEFSKGHDTISEVDFAKILLRYTHLDTNEYACCNKYCMIFLTTLFRFLASYCNSHTTVMAVEECFMGCLWRCAMKIFIVLVDYPDWDFM